VLVVSTCFDRKTQRNAEVAASACDAIDVGREAFARGRIDAASESETSPQELLYQADSAVNTGDESLDRAMALLASGRGQCHLGLSGLSRIAASSVPDSCALSAINERSLSSEL
jgi:hypothetical protein